MFRTLTAFTMEADVKEDAVQEILEQLDLENQLLENAVGFFTCYLDHIKSGVIEAINEALPFEVIGCTVPMSGVSVSGEQAQLSLMVFTSDDTEFSVTLSEQFIDQSGEKFDSLIEDMWHKVCQNRKSEAEMLLVCQPFVLGFNWQGVTTSLAAYAGNIPIFGTLAIDIELELREPLVVFNGQSYADRMAILAIGGSDLKPTFVVESFNMENNIAQDAIITAVDGIRLLSINDMPAVEYLTKIGMASDGKINNAGNIAVPIAVDVHDGTKPRVGTFYSLDDEGAVICGQELPVGASLTIGIVTNDAVLSSAKDALQQIALSAHEREEPHAIIVFSCFSRAIVINDMSDEYHMTRELLDPTGVPFMFSYSGGEICPLYNRNGEYVNISHVFSLVGVIF